MQKLTLFDLKPGTTFPEAIFSATGQRLMGANVLLTARHVDLLRRSGECEFFVARDAEELLAGGVVQRVDSANLQVGHKASAPVLSRAGHVVVDTGEEVEEHHLDALAAGGGQAFAGKVQPKVGAAGNAAGGQTESASERRERIMMADATVQDLEQRAASLELRVVAQAAADWLKPADPGGWPTPQQLSDQRRVAVERLRGLAARIEAGVPTPISAFHPIIDELLAKLMQYPSRFTQIALLCPGREDYLPDHIYTVAVISMAVAAQLKWPLMQVRRLGEAAVVFDLGMLLVPERVRVGGGGLDEHDRVRVHRHPVYGAALLQSVEGVDPLVQLTALQHHERDNGTGYPRGLRGVSICDYARVISVADAFAATTEPRKYRKQKMPYVAMEETLRSTTAQAFWKPAMRALLQACGLFPAGSYVKLSNGMVASVIAANSLSLDRPVVQPLTHNGEPKGALIDLAAIPPTQLTITRPMQRLDGEDG